MGLFGDVGLELLVAEGLLRKPQARFAETTTMTSVERVVAPSRTISNAWRAAQPVESKGGTPMV